MSLLSKAIYRRCSSYGLPGGSDGKESACIVGHWGSITRSERSPAEGNDTHSGILAWIITWTEDPGELQSMGSQRVGHNFVTNTPHYYYFYFILFYF